MSTLRNITTTTCNSASIFPLMKDLNTTYCQPSNLIPHFWNYKIVDKDGSPDLPCIMLLSELFGWIRNLPKSNTYYSKGNSLPELTEDGLAISYEFLSEKLNFQKERIRRKFTKLESLGILSREVKNIALEGGDRINQLYISLDHEFFKSCFRDPQIDIRVRNSDIAASGSKAFKPSTPYGVEHISKKNKNRSMKSNFLEISFEGIKTQTEEDRVFSEENNEDEIDKDYKNEDQKEIEEINNSNLQKNSTSKPVNQPLLQQIHKSLEDFYPLTQEDCRALQSSSGREFNLNAMNEILQDMSKKLTDRFFYSKKGFLSYMSKVFQYEKRDSVVISNATFKIRANQSEEEKTIQIQEKYLTELEYSLQVSPEWHLKKKLASVLARDKAYHLLTSYNSIEIKEDRAILHLNRNVTFSKMDENIILSQIQATHEQTTLEGNCNKIEVLEIRMPEKAKQFKQKGTVVLPREASSKLPANIWGRVRSSLIKQYGEAIDTHWFSKLTAEINEKEKTIKLEAKSSFIKSWIESNYFQEIASIIKSNGFSLGGIEC